MGDIDCVNLIDLSLEEDLLIQHMAEEPILIKTEENVAEQPTLAPAPASNPSTTTVMQNVSFISPSWKKRDSLDNNPFDCVQKLANNRQDDPFDVVEKEACIKARLVANPPVEVKLGNLLSLSNENLLDDVDNLKQVNGKKNVQNFDLESESPPVAMIEKVTTAVSDTDTDSNPNSSAESAGSSKIKKTMEYRKRLLKLSVTNSAFNSPASRRSLEQSDSPSTPVSSLHSKLSQYEENLLAAESPLKFVDDDIMSEEPPSPILDAEKNFEADLEMLKIPMLNEINSSSHDDSLLALENKILESVNEINAPSTAISDLEAIKAKLKARKIESNNNHHQDINMMISELKVLISGGSVDSVTKLQASNILETLSSALSTSHAKDNSTDNTMDTLSLPPQPIKRQGTFDIELQDDDDQVENEENDHKNILEKQPTVTELPNCMVSSTATYDGDAVNERLHDLQLPEIDPPSPELEQQPQSEMNYQTDMNDIMEQISKLLISNQSGDATQNAQQNPTVIVVMNTAPITQQVPSTMTSSYLDNSIRENLQDLNESNTNFMPRRRSQSLSLHDKVKIVQMPLKPPTPQRVKKQHSIDLDDSPTLATTPPPNDKETPEFKTPARMIRRNSYSSGTPYTATAGLKKSGFSSAGKPINHIRRTPTLDTHHEGQQKAIVRPMTMPVNNLAAFKPDLKKKHKPNTESIMKSSGPLKATIPVKKVAPMIKTTAPLSPGHNTISPNSELQLKTNQISSTPNTSKRPTKLGVAPGYPNACSTPSNSATPMKRTSLAVTATKPRYSYMSATPNPKSNLSFGGSSSNLKRRTITDFKVRSPLKPRMSTSIAVSSTKGATSSTAAAAATARLSISAGARMPNKAAAKTAVNTATVKPTNRFGSSRLTGVGSTLTARNKENKQP